MKVNSVLRIVFLFLFFVSFLSSAECIKEGDKVELTGIVKKELFYGPPNFGEDKESDEKLSYFILHLDKALTCVTDASQYRKDWGSKIQLILDENDYKKYVVYQNKHMTITGRIMLQQNGYHVTPVLLSDISHSLVIK